MRVRFVHHRPECKISPLFQANITPSAFNHKRFDITADRQSFVDIGFQRGVFATARRFIRRD